MIHHPIFFQTFCAGTAVPLSHNSENKWHFFGQKSDYDESDIIGTNVPLKKVWKKMVNIVSWDDVKMVLGRLSHCPKIVTLVAWHFFGQKSHLYDKSSIFGTKVPSFWDKSLVIVKVYKNVTPLVWLECDSGTAVPLKKNEKKKRFFNFPSWLG